MTIANEHAQWSASATDRNWNCPGALALTDGLPETTNEAADWGTCCHTLAERCLRNGVDADSFLGETLKGKKYEFEVDEEMAETAQMYVNYVRKQVAAAVTARTTEAELLHIEQKFSLASLKPPFEAGGTADAVIYFPAEQVLEVIDLKGGRGVVVEATGNKQLRTYALGAMLANPHYEVDEVKVTIVQPRAGHKDGRIRSETFHVADLIDWTAELVQAMKRASAASDFRKDVPEAAWAAEYLLAGDHCKFCKAAGFCPALEQKALDAVGVWFDDLDQPRISNTPDTMDVVKLSQTLDMLGMIEDWANAVRAHAHRQAELGVEIPAYQLVDKIGRRKWCVSEEQVKATLEAEGVDPFEYKLSSPAQAEKKLKGKKGVIKDFSETPVTGTNLVRVDKTTRPAVQASVNRHFDVLD